MRLEFACVLGASKSVLHLQESVELAVVAFLDALIPAFINLLKPIDPGSRLAVHRIGTFARRCLELGELDDELIHFLASLIDFVLLVFFLVDFFLESSYCGVELVLVLIVADGAKLFPLPRLRLLSFLGIVSVVSFVVVFVIVIVCNRKKVKQARKLVTNKT